jgi:hypothetical protein
MEEKLIIMKGRLLHTGATILLDYDCTKFDLGNLRKDNSINTEKTAREDNDDRGEVSKDLEKNKP